MTSIAVTSRESSVRGIASLPARVAAHGVLPWIPLAAGKSFKPLRFMRDNRGFVELLRLEPGAVIPVHRHTGEVHAFNLEGTRELCTGERVGPGDYVYEPAGNIDAWEAVGEVPLVVFVVVMGAVEYLGPDDSVTARYTAETLRIEYHRYCAQKNIEPLDLDD